MEYLNPRFKIIPPNYYLPKPQDCKYYLEGCCLGQKYTPPCDGESCEIYLSDRKPQIITLCGSTRFKDLFLEAARDLTLQGWIVLMPGVFGHADNFEWTEKQKKNLDELHLEKIRMSNAVFLLNKGGYIGDSTRREIEYAASLKIPIYKYE